MRTGEEFFNLYAHDLLRVAVGTPGVRVGDPAFNAEHLYYMLRFSCAPTKVAFLAWCAWHEQHRIGEIKRTLAIFLERFFKLSQFKRSCMPNGPKVGSGGSLSPRGDWRAPSDAGRTFVLTGALAGLTRDEAAARIEARGGRVTDAVSRHTDFVVVGEAPGRKREDARRLGVRTLDRAGLEALLA